MKHSGFSWGPGMVPPPELEKMDEETYKLAKENFVAGQSGGHMSEVMALMAINASSALFARVLFSFLDANEFAAVHKLKVYQRFILEFLLFVLPVLAAFTIAAERVVTIVVVQASLSAALHMLSISLSGRSLLSLEPHGSKARRLRVSRKPFITYYRACMLLATCVAILAVDFDIFPRRFAKSETFGTSLMDVGVGAFVFSAAIVSPQARTSGRLAGATRGAQLLAAAKKTFATIRAVSPMILLGVGRLVATRGANYQLHVSEYGVHWNFFFTMAGVSLASVLFECLVALLAPQGASQRTDAANEASTSSSPTPDSPDAAQDGDPSLTAKRRHSRSRSKGRATEGQGTTDQLRIKAPASVDSAAPSVSPDGASLPGGVYILLAGVLTIGYQCALSYGGWEQFILHAPRTDLFSANREGIMGMCGFVAIYLCGVVTGRLLASVPPSQTAWWETLQRLTARSLAAWVALLLLTGDWVAFVPEAFGQPSAGMSLPVSRRLANASYVVWVVAFDLTMLSALLAMDMLVVTYEQSEREPWVKPPSTPSTPQLRAAAAAEKVAQKTKRLDKDIFFRNDSLLLLSLNQNGLAAFILASVATGMVNMFSRTLFVTAVPAFAVLCGYLLVVCATMVCCYRFKLVLKFW